MDEQELLVLRQAKPEGSRLRIRGVEIGGGGLTLIAGPCAVESREQMLASAEIVSRGGATILRGGAFKPRTSPYSFQGLGEKGLEYLAEAGEQYQLVTITEVMEGEQIPLVASYADILQVGARNMQNFGLLKKLGRTSKPVLLKRAPCATYEDLLMAAEYLLSEGNDQVVLCERGIRTFEPTTRNTLDLTAIPILRDWTHLPLVVDPSHATGLRRAVPAMARAAVAAGADGVMVEVHPEPELSLSDAHQALGEEEFLTLARELRAIHAALHQPLHFEV